MLCKKRIIDVAFGSGPHVLAVSESKQRVPYEHDTGQSLYNAMFGIHRT